MTILPNPLYAPQCLDGVEGCFTQHDPEPRGDFARVHTLHPLNSQGRVSVISSKVGIGGPWRTFVDIEDEDSPLEYTESVTLSMLLRYEAERIGSLNMGFSLTAAEGYAEKWINSAAPTDRPE